MGWIAQAAIVPPRPCLSPKKVQLMIRVVVVKLLGGGDGEG